MTNGAQNSHSISDRPSISSHNRKNSERKIMMNKTLSPRSPYRSNLMPARGKHDLFLEAYQKDAGVHCVDLKSQSQLSTIVEQREDACDQFHKLALDNTVNDVAVPESEENKKSVRFGGNITIREHKLEIANTSWRNGPPLTLSWEQTHIQHVDLDDFEKYREKGRRLQKDLWTSADDRRSMLKEVGGFSEKDLILAERHRKAVSIPTRASSNSKPRRKVPSRTTNLPSPICT